MRKLKHLLAIVAAIVAMFSITARSANAQNHSDLCNPDDPNCGAWAAVPGNPQTLTIAPGCVITVDVFVRVCNGERQFRYGNYNVVNDPLTGTSNCSIFWSGALTQLIDLAVLQQQYNGLVPDCTDDPSVGATRVQLFSANCYARQECSYTFACDADPFSCNIDQANPPFSPIGPTTINIVRYLACGTACCAREYRVCKQTTGGTNPTTTVHITRINTTTRVACSNPQGYSNCTPSCD